MLWTLYIPKQTKIEITDVAAPYRKRNTSALLSEPTSSIKINFVIRILYVLYKRLRTEFSNRSLFNVTAYYYTLVIVHI